MAQWVVEKFTVSSWAIDGPQSLAKFGEQEASACWGEDGLRLASRKTQVGTGEQKVLDQNLSAEIIC